MTTVIELKDRAVTTTVGLAPGVGIIKQVTRSDGVEATRALKSFAPGK